MTTDFGKVLGSSPGPWAGRALVRPVKRQAAATRFFMSKKVEVGKK
jgi:hypothetical protein